MKLRDHHLTLDELKCADNLHERKVVFVFCLLKSIVQSRYLHIQYITAHSFYSVACVVRSLQCSLSLLQGEGPFLSPCASVIYILSSDWHTGRF